eukprot:2120105-Rhodomonas_salina.2
MARRRTRRGCGGGGRGGGWGGSVVKEGRRRVLRRSLGWSEPSQCEEGDAENLKRQVCVGGGGGDRTCTGSRARAGQLGRGRVRCRR